MDCEGIEEALVGEHARQEQLCFEARKFHQPQQQQRQRGQPHPAPSADCACHGRSVTISTTTCRQVLGPVLEAAIRLAPPPRARIPGPVLPQSSLEAGNINVSAALTHVATSGPDILVGGEVDDLSSFRFHVTLSTWLGFLGKVG